MTPNLGKTTFTEAELAQLRAEVAAFIDREGWTKRRFAEEAGVAEGTFGPWLSGTYAGNSEKVAAEVYRFIQARKEQAQLAANIPVAPEWQPTRSANKVMTILEHCQVFADLGVIGMGPGICKTATITQFRATRPRVWVATMAPSTRGVPNALVEMLDAMGEGDAKGTPQGLSRRVQKKVGPGGLIVIDEAQHLSQQAVDEFRTIHDRTGVGMVFSGDESVFQLFDGSRKAAFAQFHSRIGIRHRQARPYAEDAPMLARAHGINDLASIKLISDMAQKPGALRGVTKTLLLARRMAAMADQEMTPTLIREAWAQRAPDMTS
jgi:hypothetical protein